MRPFQDLETRLESEDIYVGNAWYPGRSVFVVGSMFGPMLLACSSLEEAVGEFDERHGQRIEPDDSALDDFEGTSLEARIESALNSGEARYNDGGTLVWVDPYEWVREFRTVREAGEFYRRGWKAL